MELPCSDQTPGPCCRPVRERAAPHDLVRGVRRDAAADGVTRCVPASSAPRSWTRSTSSPPPGSAFCRSRTNRAPPTWRTVPGASGRHGVCIAQDNPGTTNFVTGVAAAYWAHSPVVFITPETGSDVPRASAASRRPSSCRSSRRSPSTGARQQRPNGWPNRRRAASTVPMLEMGPAAAQHPARLSSTARSTRRSSAPIRVGRGPAIPSARCRGRPARRGRSSR